MSQAPDVNLNQYQLLAARTIKPELTSEQLEDMVLLGIIGELGEFTELFKKLKFHGKELTADRAREEAGDLLWYIAAAATQKQTALSDMAGLEQFAAFDQAASDTVAKTLEQTPNVKVAELCSAVPLFFALAKLVTGETTVAQALTVLAVILHPYGGLAWAALDNVRKLETRHNIPAGDVTGVVVVGGSK